MVTLCVAFSPWQAALRSTVVTRESDHFWRRTDDEHPECVLRSWEFVLRLKRVGQYVLCGYTDESSATRTLYGLLFKDLLWLRGIGQSTIPHLSPTEIACHLFGIMFQIVGMKYRCVATSPEGLVQQVAVSYLRHGYWWYVAGRIPANKDREQVDRKLVAKYGIDISERQRTSRKSQGLANMQYIRFDRWFCLLVTEGHHPVKSQEKVRDCRRHPIRFEGYSISYRRSGITIKGHSDPKWHACVRIDQTTYKQLKQFIVERGKHRKSELVVKDLNRIPYARYAPVRRQILNIHRAVNKARSQAGFELIPVTALRLRRHVTKPFAKRPDLRHVA